MSLLCGCFASRASQRPRVQTQIPYDPQAGFVRRDSHVDPPQYSNDPALAETEGYVPVVPLPRYTPRPVSVHEKTLQSSADQDASGAATRRDPDEKNRRDFEDPSSQPTENNTSADDASSAFSFPSSFGHTSTETRDTPPPPYSSCTSLVPPRSRASSMNQRVEVAQMTAHHMQGPSPITPPPMVHIPQPRPVFQRPGFIYGSRGPYPDITDHMTGGRPRRSWDSQ
ncbi:hypothetical protein VTN77DRAFT_4549 [Rasamsonia byssochlamydoides]|uniref:uncharacterized protein n=1 Tax=Rasamsonia byssochlamydoides TaxID=89139 RepID=UPI003742D4A6